MKKGFTILILMLTMFIGFIAVDGFAKSFDSGEISFSIDDGTNDTTVIQSSKAELKTTFKYYRLEKSKDIEEVKGFHFLSTANYNNVKAGKGVIKLTLNKFINWQKHKSKSYIKIREKPDIIYML